MHALESTTSSLHQPVLRSQSRQGSYSCAFAHAESRLAVQPKISTCRHRERRLNTVPIPSPSPSESPYRTGHANHITTPGPAPMPIGLIVVVGCLSDFALRLYSSCEPRGRASKRVSFPQTAIGRLESNTTPDTPQTQRVARRNAAGNLPQRHPRRTETDRWGWPQIALARQCAPRGKCLTRYSLHPRRTF